MNKKLLLGTLAVVLLAAVLLPVVQSRQQSRTEFMMDTYVTITAPRSAKQTVDACFAEIARLEGLLSAYRTDSEISRVNEEGYDHPVAVSDEVFALLKKAQILSAATDGTFDITVKPLIDLWDMRSGRNAVPSDDAIAAVLPSVGYENLVLDEETKTVQFTVPGMGIELGAIAKGYAGDRVRDILESAGVNGAIVDLGGNIVTTARKNGKPWRIGLQDPDQPRGSYFTTVESAGESVVTSGPYERYFEKDGKSYHHILDPRTGWPADTGLKSVTVISEDGTLADALSTALFVMGPDAGLAFADGSQLQAILLTDTKEIRYSQTTGG